MCGAGPSVRECPPNERFRFSGRSESSQDMSESPSTSPDNARASVSHDGKIDVSDVDAATKEARALLFEGKSFDMQVSLTSVLLAANAGGAALLFNAILDSKVASGWLVWIGTGLFGLGAACSGLSFFTLRDLARSVTDRIRLRANSESDEAAEREHVASASWTANYLIVATLTLIIGMVVAIVVASSTVSDRRELQTPAARQSTAVTPTPSH